MCADLKELQYKIYDSAGDTITISYGLVIDYSLCSGAGCDNEALVLYRGRGYCIKCVVNTILIEKRGDMRNIDEGISAADSIDYRRGFLVGVGIVSTALILPLLVCVFTLVFTGGKYQQIPVIFAFVWLFINSWLFKRINSSIRARVTKIIPEGE